MGLGVDPFSNYNGNSWSTVATPTKYTDEKIFNMYYSGNDSQKQEALKHLYSGNHVFGDNEFSQALTGDLNFNQDFSNYGQQQLEKTNNSSSSMSGMDIANATFQGLSALTSAGTSIANSVLGWKNYAQNKKLINKQIDAINEQITASQEYRQQRKDEIARLNRVRSNTQKSFNTGTTITRSY